MESKKEKSDHQNLLPIMTISNKLQTKFWELK